MNDELSTIKFVYQIINRDIKIFLDGVKIHLNSLIPKLKNFLQVESQLCGMTEIFPAFPSIEKELFFFGRVKIDRRNFKLV